MSSDDESFEYPNEDYIGGEGDDDDIYHHSDTEETMGEESVEPPEEESEDEITFKQPKSFKSVHFEVLSPENLVKDYQKLVQSVMEVLGIPSPTAAAVLLKHFKWNQHKLIDEYSNDPDTTLQQAGVPGLVLETPPPPSMQEFRCMVCLETTAPQNSYALACNHRYCNECWHDYLMLKLKEGPASVHSHCMYPKCKVVIHEDTFQKLVSPADIQTYQKFLMKSYVDDNPKMKWCPAPGCEHAIRCDVKKENVTCGCGFTFCFNCADYAIGDHMPATCDQVERWLQKASDESENVTWMIANTKKCPECRSPIEKNGGCMHMTCRKESGGCGYEFCWLCRGKWSDHGSHTGGYYDCNKYDKSNAKQEDVTAQNIKTELEQYMFFYHRFEAHKNAGKIANEQRKNCEKRSRQILEKYEVRATDTKFLTDATEQLIANRLVLQWSYVMGYYNIIDGVKPAERNLFEYLQEDLEKHTNHLSELYEQPLEGIPDYHTFMKWKEDVTNYTRVTKKFLDNFTEGVSGGLTSSQ